MTPDQIIQWAREAGLAEVTDTNQNLRQALQALLKRYVELVNSGDAGNWDPEAEPEVIAARQVLALPTAEQVDDINVAESFTSVTKTAALVGERDAFERTMMDKFGWQRNDFKLDDFGYFDGHTDTAWMAWQARAALSAGDAVDAQRYRWLADCLNYPEAVTLISDGSLTEDALGKAIDAAMRKDNP